jgi:hypothetical protein
MALAVPASDFGVILRSGHFAASRRMMFSSVLAAILRGSQELAPQDDVRDCFIGSSAEAGARRNGIFLGTACR